MIDFGEINGEERSKTMAFLHQACEQWGFFQVKRITFFFFLSLSLSLNGCLLQN